MRKITKQAVVAFLNDIKFSLGNTTCDGAGRMYLHGNLIAEKRRNTIRMTLAGWPTPTTRERLNGICVQVLGGAMFSQRNHLQWFGRNDIYGLTRCGAQGRIISNNVWVVIKRAQS